MGRPGRDPSETGHAFRAFRNRNFTIFWTGALLSNSGAWLSNLTVPYVLFQLTGSAVWTGVASVAQFVPQMLLTPLAGNLADRFNRRSILLLTQSAMSIAAFALWLVWLSASRNDQSPYPLLAALGPAWAFSFNAVSYVAVILSLLVIRLPRVQAGPPDARARSGHPTARTAQARGVST